MTPRKFTVMPGGLDGLKLRCPEGTCYPSRIAVNGALLAISWAFRSVLRSF